MAKRFIKIYDRKRSQFYYQNTYTLRVSWTKPSILGNAEIPEFVPSAESVKKKKRRREEKEGGAFGDRGLWAWRCSLCIIKYSRSHPTAVSPEAKANSNSKPKPALTEDEAARKLQSLWRFAKARKMIMSVIRARFQKVYDDKTQAWFYFDTSNKTSSWTKPKLLKSGDLQATTEFGVGDVGGGGGAGEEKEGKEGKVAVVGEEEDVAVVGAEQVGREQGPTPLYPTPRPQLNSQLSTPAQSQRSSP